jgi:iron complex outermembrane receptor protein
MLKTALLISAVRLKFPTLNLTAISYHLSRNVSYIHTKEKTEWVTGANVWTDKFTEKKLTDFPVRDYNMTTFGLFVQNNTKITDWMNLETGLRTDYITDYGFAVLPRISSHFKITEKFHHASVADSVIKHLRFSPKTVNASSFKMFCR